MTDTKTVLQKQLRKVKKFADVASPLDHSDARSGIYSSDFRGIYHLAIICGGLYMLSTFISNMSKHESIFADSVLLLSVFASRGLIEVLATFACQALFTYTGMIPVFMARSPKYKDNMAWIHFIHHALQTVLFASTMAIIYIQNWTLVHSVSVFMEGVVLLLKMHSYVRTQFALITVHGVEEHPAPTFRDYTMYLLFPTLVYETSYPRTNHIRWGYLLEKATSNCMGMSVMYIIVTDHVVPRLQESAYVNPVLVTTQLLLPFLGVILTFWFVVFESLMPGIAEVTYFADRDFYDDWWNSTTFDEFARKWNKPVHEFLLRHVYYESLDTGRLSRTEATMLTFFMSAAVHECVFVVAFRTVRLYFFVLQMAQVIIIMYGRGLKGTRLGNTVFWLGIIVGVPLQAVLYSREYFGGESIFVEVMIPIMIVGFGSALVASFLSVSSGRVSKTERRRCDSDAANSLAVAAKQQHDKQQEKQEERQQEKQKSN